MIRKGRAEEWLWYGWLYFLGLNSSLSLSWQWLCTSLIWFCLSKTESHRYPFFPLLWALTLKITGIVSQPFIHPFKKHSVFILPVLRKKEECWLNHLLWAYSDFLQLREALPYQPLNYYYVNFQKYSEGTHLLAIASSTQMTSYTIGRT